jgi:alpha-1,3-rhamnosyl/mannosyltransferase
MRVIFNQLSALGPKTGIGHYTEQLFLGVLRQARAGEFEGFPQGWVRWARRVGVHLRPYLEGKKAGRSRLRRAVLDQLRHWSHVVVTQHFQRWCQRHSYTLYHEPNFNPLPVDVPTVATLHDLSVVLHPEWHPADRVRHFERHFPQTLARCRHFVTDSDCVRREVIRELGVRPQRVTRIYNGIRATLGPLPADLVAEVLHRLGLPARYLLCVGTIEPRKNILRLLQAYCSLPGTIREGWPLVLVGGWGWSSRAVADYLHDVARHRGVVHVGYVSEEHLAALYNGARALVYPSLYEGFGLPPLEMMACGGAVVASAAAALVETVGRQAHLVAPEDLDGWRDAMAQVVTDDDWWHALRRGARAVSRAYTWQRCAAETLDLYRTLSGGEQSVPLADRPGYQWRDSSRAA